MRIIEVKSLENGAHNNQELFGDMQNIPDGWAIIPDDFEIPSSFPFVNLILEGQYVNDMVSISVPALDIEEVKHSIESILSNACSDAISIGTDVRLSDDSTHHFSYSVADQANVSEMFNAIVMGATEFPYHADGEECRMYSAADVVTIYATLSTYKTSQITYHNQLKRYVQSLTDVRDVNAVSYGVPLTGEYLETYNTLMAQANEQMGKILAKMQPEQEEETQSE